MALRAMVSSQVPNCASPRKLPQERAARRKVSCTASSAASPLPVMPRAKA
jgi:hypothetical protein